MNRVSDYRRKAEENESLARLMSRHDHREHFLEVARAWRELERATLEDMEAVEAPKVRLKA